MGDVLAPYDRSGMFAAYGFGGDYAPVGTSHCFNVNLADSPYLNGIDGVLTAYRESFKRVTLSGPTFFSHIIQRVNQVAMSYPKGSKYQILLIVRSLIDCTVIFNDQFRLLMEPSTILNPQLKS